MVKSSHIGVELSLCLHNRIGIFSSINVAARRLISLSSRTWTSTTPEIRIYHPCDHLTETKLWPRDHQSIRTTLISTTSALSSSSPSREIPRVFDSSGVFRMSGILDDFGVLTVLNRGNLTLVAFRTCTPVIQKYLGTDIAFQFSK